MLYKTLWDNDAKRNSNANLNINSVGGLVRMLICCLSHFNSYRQLFEIKFSNTSFGQLKRRARRSTWTTVSDLEGNREDPNVLEIFEGFSFILSSKKSFHEKIGPANFYYKTTGLSKLINLLDRTHLLWVLLLS